MRRRDQGSKVNFEGGEKKKKEYRRRGEPGMLQENAVVRLG